MFACDQLIRIRKDLKKLRRTKPDKESNETPVKVVKASEKPVLAVTKASKKRGQVITDKLEYNRALRIWSHCFESRKDRAKSLDEYNAIRKKSGLEPQTERELDDLEIERIANIIVP